MFYRVTLDNGHEEHGYIFGTHEDALRRYRQSSDDGDFSCRVEKCKSDGTVIRILAQFERD